MKRISIAGLSTLIPFLAAAQPRANYEINMHAFGIVSTIIVVGLFMIFIISILKRILDFRLKNKIMDKGLPESVISTFFQTEQQESFHQNLKWFAVLASVGIGLILVYYTMPLDIHSLAIMSLSISLGFLGYFFYMRKISKEEDKQN